MKRAAAKIIPIQRSRDVTTFNDDPDLFKKVITSDE